MSFLRYLIPTILVFTACERPRLPLSRAPDGPPVVRLASVVDTTTPAWATKLVYSTLGNEAAALDRFVDARFLPDTTLVVTRGTELLFFNPRGQLTRSVGRAGKGPGEFGLITDLGQASDGTLLIHDFNDGRLTELSPTGHLRVLPYLGRPNPTYELVPLTLLADGGIVATYWQLRPNRDTPGLQRDPFDRDSAPLLVFDSLGRRTTALGTWPGLERGREGPMRLAPPFARTTLARGRGQFVAITPTDSLDLTLFRDTTPVARLAAPAPKRSPTAAQLAAWEQVLRAEMADVAETYLDVVQREGTVPTLPALGGLALDDNANVWVGSFAAPGDTSRTWTVLRPTGSRLGRLNLPAFGDRVLPGHLEVLDVYGDHIALLRESPDGEFYVEVLMILRHL